MTFVSTRVQSGLSRREYDEAIVKMSQSKALTKKDKEILIKIGHFKSNNFQNFSRFCFRICWLKAFQ